MAGEKDPGSKQNYAEGGRSGHQVYYNPASNFLPRYNLAPDLSVENPLGNEQFTNSPAHTNSEGNMQLPNVGNVFFLNNFFGNPYNLDYDVSCLGVQFHNNPASDFLPPNVDSANIGQEQSDIAPVDSEKSKKRKKSDKSEESKSRRRVASQRFRDKKKLEAGLL